jgi:succinate dehydrogenase/fumarate reductase flavoprotein subunit
MGVDGGDQVYLDLTHLGRAKLEEKVKGVVEIYEKFVGDDPAKVPMKVFPGMHYSMGGLWIDYDHMTNIPGLFAAGDLRSQLTRQITTAVGDATTAAIAVEKYLVERRSLLESKARVGV